MDARNPISPPNPNIIEGEDDYIHHNVDDYSLLSLSEVIQALSLDPKTVLEGERLREGEGKDESEGKGEDEGEDSVPRLSTFVSFSEGPYIARIPYISIRAFLLSILAASFLNGYGSLEARQPELATC